MLNNVKITMVKELYIVRHGETIENLEEVIQGSLLDGRLSEKGKEQARILGKKLRNIKVDKIYSSDLGRAVETTKEILKNHNVPVDYIPELKERSYGSIQGKTIQEAGIKNYKGAYLYSLNQEGIFSDAESLKSIDERVDRIIQKIFKSEGSVFILVGHEWINSYLVNKLLRENYVFHEQDNASFHYFKLDENGKVLEYKLNNNKNDT